MSEPGPGCQACPIPGSLSWCSRPGLNPREEGSWDIPPAGLLEDGAKCEFLAVCRRVARKVTKVVILALLSSRARSKQSGTRNRAFSANIRDTTLFRSELPRTIQLISDSVLSRPIPRVDSSLRRMTTLGRVASSGRVTQAQGRV